MAQPIPRRDQRRLLLVGRIDRLDLGELEREQVELPLPSARELSELVGASAPPRTRRVARGPFAQLSLLGPGEGVEDVELGGGQHQLAVLVLAVEGEQRAAELTKVRDVAERPQTYARVRPSGQTRRASTSSSAPRGSARRRASRGGSAKTPST